MRSGRVPTIRIHPYMRGRTMLTSLTGFKFREPKEPERPIPLQTSSTLPGAAEKTGAPPELGDNEETEEMKTREIRSRPPSEDAAKPRETRPLPTLPPEPRVGPPRKRIHNCGMVQSDAPGARTPKPVEQGNRRVTWPVSSEFSRAPASPIADDDQEETRPRTSSAPPIAGPPPKRARVPPPPKKDDGEGPGMFRLEDLGVGAGPKRLPPVPRVPNIEEGRTSIGLGLDDNSSEWSWSSDDDQAKTTKLERKRSLPKPPPLERAAPPVINEAPMTDGIGNDDSFMAGLGEIHQIEEGRIADEEAERRNAEAAQRLDMARRIALEAHRRKSSRAPPPRRSSRPAVANVPIPPTERPKWHESLPEPPVKGAAQEPDASMEVITTGEIKFDVGIPWEDKIITFKLNPTEKASCENALEERKRRYIYPAPEADSESAVLLTPVLGDKPMVIVGGKPYYILDTPDFKDAKVVAMVGETLYVWPTEMTSLSLLQSIGVESPEYEIVKWGKNPVLEVLDDERSLVYEHIPENQPRLLYPVPSTDTKHNHNLQVLETYRAQPVVSIGGRQYYVMNIRNMAEWKLHIENLPAARMVVRGGERVTPWTGQGMNGYSLFKWPKGSREGSYGKKGAPLRPKHIGECLEEIYETEVAAVREVYDNGQKTRYLHPMPENIGEMDAERYDAVMSTARSYIENNQHSPLISIRGRWYLALEAPWINTRTSTFEDDRIRLHSDAPKQKDLRSNAREPTEEITGSMLMDATGALTSSMVLEEDTPIIGLPEDMEARLPFMAKFPENQSRWLMEVGLDEEVQGLSTVQVSGEDKDHNYVIFKMPVDNSFEVKRIGDIIYLVKHAERK